jgi:hypothetical protein
MDTVEPNKDAATPSAKQRPDEKKILRARPVKGEIDYPGLIRNTIARFPKILAALAK